MSNFRISVTQIWHSGIPHIGTNSNRFLYSHEIFHLVNYFLLISILFIYYFWNFISGWGWNKTMFSWLSDQRYNFLVSKQIKKDFRTLVTYDHFLVISVKQRSQINFHKKTSKYGKTIPHFYLRTLKSTIFCPFWTVSIQLYTVFPRFSRTQPPFINSKMIQFDSFC